MTLNGRKHPVRTIAILPAVSFFLIRFSPEDPVAVGRMGEAQGKDDECSPEANTEGLGPGSSVLDLETGRDGIGGSARPR